MLLFIVLLVHKHLIDISCQMIRIRLHDGVLVPRVSQESFHAGVEPRPHGQDTRMSIEIGVTAGRREVPCAGARAGEPKLPLLLSRIEHLRPVLLTCAGVHESDRSHDIEGIPRP